MIALPFLILGGRPTTTRTFSTSQTFVMPTGVTRLLKLSGRGEDGATVWNNSTFTAGTIGSSTTGGTLIGASLTYGTTAAGAQAYLDSLNTGGTGQRTISPANAPRWRWDSTASQWRQDTFGGMISSTVRGSAVQTGTTWSLTGTITTPPTARTYQGQIEALGTTPGADTTGFGLVFDGGTSGAAVIENFTNVAVTPGTSYPLTIATGGFITITYEVS